MERSLHHDHHDHHDHRHASGDDHDHDLIVHHHPAREAHDDSCQVEARRPPFLTRANTEPLHLPSRPRWISVSTTTMVCLEEAIQRRFSCVSYKLHGSDEKPAETKKRRSLSIVVKSPPQHQTVRKTTISIDVLLLKLLLLFSLLSTATGLTFSSGLPQRMWTPAVLHASARTAGARMDLEDSFDGWGVSSDVPRVLSRRDVAACIADAYTTDAYGATAGLRTAKQRAALEAAAAVEVPPPPERIYYGSELEARLQQRDGVPTVVVFGAKRCRMCRVLQPKLEKLAVKGGARFLFLYHDKLTETAFAEHGVTETPTTFVYDAQGHEVGREVYSSRGLREFEALLARLQGGRACEWSAYAPDREERKGEAEDVEADRSDLARLQTVGTERSEAALFMYGI